MVPLYINFFCIQYFIILLCFYIYIYIYICILTKITKKTYDFAAEVLHLKIELIQTECVTCRARPWEIYGNRRLTYPHTKPNRIITGWKFQVFDMVFVSILPAMMMRIAYNFGDGSANQIGLPYVWCCLRRILSVPRFSMQPPQAVAVVEHAVLDGKMSVSAAAWWRFMLGFT